MWAWLKKKPGDHRFWSFFAISQQGSLVTFFEPARVAIDAGRWIIDSERRQIVAAVHVWRALGRKSWRAIFSSTRKKYHGIILLGSEFQGLHDYQDSKTIAKDDPKANDPSELKSLRPSCFSNGPLQRSLLAVALDQRFHVLSRRVTGDSCCFDSQTSALQPQINYPTASKLKTTNKKTMRLEIRRCNGPETTFLIHFNHHKAYTRKNYLSTKHFF